MPRKCGGWGRYLITSLLVSNLGRGVAQLTGRRGGYGVASRTRRCMLSVRSQTAGVRQRGKQNGSQGV